MKKLPNTQTPAFYVVIPARYASTRLPGKPLLDIAGKPMVVWVAERAHMSGAHQVVIATDDQRISDAAQHHGFTAVRLGQIMLVVPTVLLRSPPTKLGLTMLS